MIRLVSLFAAAVFAVLGFAAASATPARPAAQMHMYPSDPPVIRG